MSTTSERPTKRRTLTQRDARLGLWLMSPTLLIVLALVVFPLLWAILLSFQRMRLIQVGTADFFQPLTLANYKRVIGSGELLDQPGDDVRLHRRLGHPRHRTRRVGAMAVRKKFRGRTFVRAAFLLPYVAPVVAVTFIWRTMLNPQFGIINEIGQSVFGWDEPIAFLSQAVGTWNVFGLEIPVPTALLTTIVFEGWRYFPFVFLFLMARLEAMSEEPEEAALVDGATPWQSFRHIVFPQLVPIIGLLAVLRTIWTFNEFDDIFLLTGGAAGTGVASVQIYNFLTVQRNVGAAAAQSVIMSLVLVCMLGIYMLILRRRGEKA